MMNENYEHVKAIAKELAEIVNGDFVKYDYDAYEVKEDENGERYADIDGTIYREGDDENDLDDLEQYTLYDYFEDVYDIEYTVDGQKEYKAVRLMVACGGPNIYINTRTGNVELYWWTDRAEYPLDSDVVEEIDAIYEEYFNCI